MKLELNTNEISEETLRRIVVEIKDLAVLDQLAEIDYSSVAKRIITNPITTKEIRHKIYLKWCAERKDLGALRCLVDCPLSSETIHAIVENWCDGEPDLCKELVSQKDITLEDMKLIYATMTAGDLAVEEVIEVLSDMAERENLDQELMQKLVDYSPEVAAQVALHHSDLIRVDFSKRQTE